MVCCKCYDNLPYPHKCPQCKTLVQEADSINRIVRQLLEGIHFECQEANCPDFEKTFKYKDYYEHLKCHGLLVRKPCPKGCGKLLFYKEMEKHLKYDKYDAFLKEYGKNYYEKYDGSETCLNNTVTCKTCRDDVKLTKMIKHECFNNALITCLFQIIKSQSSQEPILA